MSSVKQLMKMYFRTGFSHKEEIVDVSVYWEEKTDTPEQVAAAVHNEYHSLCLRALQPGSVPISWWRAETSPPSEALALAKPKTQCALEQDFDQMKSHSIEKVFFHEISSFIMSTFSKFELNFPNFVFRFKMSYFFTKSRLKTRKKNLFFLIF